MFLDVSFVSGRNAPSDDTRTPGCDVTFATDDTSGVNSLTGVVLFSSDVTGTVLNVNNKSLVVLAAVSVTNPEDSDTIVVSKVRASVKLL